MITPSKSVADSSAKKGSVSVKAYFHVKNVVGVALLGCVLAGAALGHLEHGDLYRVIGAVAAVAVAARLKFL